MIGRAGEGCAVERGGLEPGSAAGKDGAGSSKTPSVIRLRGAT